MTKIISLFFLLTVIQSCISGRKNMNNGVAIKNIDSLVYKKIKGRFYTDSFGNIFEKKYYIGNGIGDLYNNCAYFDSICIIEIGDSILQKSLKEVIDISTYEEFEKGNLFSKDKNHVYYSYSSSSGQSRVIVNGANPNTFKPLSDYEYGIDDKNAFYKSNVIKGLNFKKYEILYSLETDFFIDYVKDDKVVFYNGDTLKGADAKTFKLVKGKKWRAEDKNYKYECCGQRFNE